MIPLKSLPGLFLVVILIISGAYLVDYYNEPTINSNPTSYIPKNADAVAYLNEATGSVFLFHSNQSAGIVFFMRQVQIASLIPPIIHSSNRVSIKQISCFQSVPIYTIEQAGNNTTKITGISSIILTNFGISTQKIIFSSPAPGIFIIGTVSSIEKSISSSCINSYNGLVGELNLSDNFSFAYLINSEDIKTVTGNYSDGILTSRILTGSINEAVGIALTLQYILGSGFISLPEMYSVLLIVPGNNGFIFLQYSLIKNILSMEGVNI